MAQQEFNFFPSVSLSSARKLECGQAEELLVSLASFPSLFSVCSLVVGATAGWALGAHTQSQINPERMSVYTTREGKHNQTDKLINCQLEHKHTHINALNMYPNIPACQIAALLLSFLPGIIPEGCSCWWVWSRCWAVPSRPAACSSCWGRGCRWPGLDPAGSHSATCPRGNLVRGKTWENPDLLPKQANANVYVH